MRNGMWRKGLIVGIILLFVGSDVVTIIKGTFDDKVLTNDNSQMINTLKNFNNDIPSFSDRTVLQGNDEGPHHNMIFDMKEWWYYNVYLNGENSELKNWFILMSIQLYPRYGGFKLELLDDGNKNYGGDDFLYYNDVVYAHEPGVNVFFNNSYLIGRYPNWRIYAKYIQPDKLEIIVNLTYKANSLPIWLIRNPGHNHSNSIFGYYCILNCTAYGTISLNGTVYNVSGLGYHDHTWAPVRLKNTTNQYIKNWGENKLPNLLYIWDWLCIHLITDGICLLEKSIQRNAIYYQNLDQALYVLQHLV